MPIDHVGDPPPKTNDKAASIAPESPPAGEATERQRSTLALMLGGIAGALTLGVLFGLWARPELIGPAPAAMPTPASSPTLGAQVPVVVAPPAKPELPPRAPGRLETLPPEMAAAARTQILPSIAPAISGLAPAEAAEAPPSPRYVASFDCATARPGAEEMVCEDPALAAADRRLARAYARAMGAGADPENLRQEQRDWVAIREDAAMQSRQALADVYDQRTLELGRIAEGAPPDEGPK